MGTRKLRSVIILTSLICLFHATSVGGMLKTASSTKEIEKWATSEFLSVRTELHQIEGVELCIVFASVTSGVQSTETYVFTKSASEVWNLILWRAMVFDQLIVYETEHALDFKNSRGLVLFSIPFDGLK